MVDEAAKPRRLWGSMEMEKPRRPRRITRKVIAFFISGSFVWAFKKTRSYP
jgi:hypothetical protein